MILTSLASSLTFSQVWPQVKVKSQALSVARKIKKNALITQLRTFSLCCLPNRASGQAGNDKALEFIVNEIEKRDSPKQGILTVQSFTPDIDYAIEQYSEEFKKNVESKFAKNSSEYKKWKDATANIQDYLKSLEGKQLKNIIWSKKSDKTNAKTYVVFANFDSIVFDNKTQKIDLTKNNPAANDNATGVVALIEMIRHFSNLNLAHNLHIVFTNTQEIGYLGARAFLNDFIKDQTIDAAFNLLMLGQDTKIKDKSARYGNYKIYLRKSNDQEMILARKFQEMAHKATKYIDYTIFPNDFDLSDHTEFWKKDIPTIVITQDFENDYNQDLHHNSNDLVETINSKSYHLVVKGSIAAISSFLLSE